MQFTTINRTSQFFDTFLIQNCLQADTTLYLLGRSHRQEFAARIAQTIHYSSRQWLAEPTIAQYQIALADSVYLLNSALPTSAQHSSLAPSPLVEKMW